FETGEPILNHIESWVDPVGVPDWFVVNKMPIRSRTGDIIGIMGFSQSYKGRAKFLEPDRGLSRAMAFIRDNYQQDISIRDLSKLAGLSPRQLERKFQAAFGQGPQQFLIKTRLRAGCQALLETKQSISEIAYGCGFCDQSAFARHFRKHLGMTPKAYRNREGKA
ncbi:MAG TPA: AraC family transcriptional regulator, partial [Verrucomicrobiae bacterium]